MAKVRLLSRESDNRLQEIFVTDTNRARILSYKGLIGTSSAPAENVVRRGDGGTFEDCVVLMSEHANRWKKRL